MTDKVTIYHVEGRRSQRIIWFCEEAGIPYEVIYKRGDVLGSLNALKKINPDMPVAPTVVFRGEMLVESGGIMEYLITQFRAAGGLVPAITSPDFAKYKMWMHFAEGSAMPHLSNDLGKLARTGGTLQPNILGPVKLVGSMDVILFMEKFISAHPYFGGANFSAADIMYDIVMTIIANLQVDAGVYPNLLKWHERVKARAAYQRAMQVGNPDNVVLKVAIPKVAAVAPAAQTAVAGRYTTAATKIGVLLADPAAKAVIDAQLPEFTKSSSVASGMANGMTLKSLQGFKPDVFTDAVLAALDAAFAKLPVK
ncbi:glutathione S-transferase family protein [Sphingomonas sp. SUN039]|uniref:glutathione S-transferase family protein n=1 Tax=Sphingomonas sp. SUN039 TaxID=2937787 RepID=UPI0021643AEB|nr:glutathione S-transferase [Sphingomonas sp. SUN039]UVO53673.1 glutathione S-transferase [Sphingomonas sp. SUN039]